MSDLIVIVPSRGRPQNILRLVQAWADTDATAKLHVGIDRDDESFNEETGQEIIDLTNKLGIFDRVVCTANEPVSMVWTLNEIAVGAANVHKYVAFMGDDHVPRTPHWDQTICGHLEGLGTGIVYGDDLFQRVNLPTAVFMTSNIIKALGYMAPPGLKHLYVDDVWRDWGQGIRKYKYLPDVVIEHMHYQAGKSQEDPGYTRVNGGAMWEHDVEAYRVYVKDQESADLEKLRAL